MIVFVLVLILSILLIVLNKILFKLLKLKSINNKRSLNRGLETYEFGTHSIGMVYSISSNQIFILSVIFLLFDIELIFLIPWVINMNLVWSIGNLVMVVFCNFIMYSLIIELYFNILVWYKNKKIKFL